jgi:hypothetical protein
LIDVRPPRAFADIDMLGTRSDRADLATDQRVVQNDVCVEQTRCGLLCEMVRMPGPGADDRHEAAPHRAPRSAERQT